MEKSLYALACHFSELHKLQTACMVTYELRKELEAEDRYRLSIRRDGVDEQEKQVLLHTDEAAALALLRLLYENAAQPEHLVDIVTDCCIDVVVHP